MKNILVIMLTVIGILFVASCSKDEENKISKLILSEKVINFDANASEKSISVVANEEWIAEGTDWITPKKEGSNLIIKVEANKTTKSREGVVSVKAGNQHETLKVTQEGEKRKIKLSTDKLTFSNTKGKAVVRINTNDKGWTANTEADWLHLTEKQNESKLIVECNENTIATERIGVITVKLGDITKTINVKQKGSLLYILPYLDFKNPTAEAIDKFEKERNSVEKEKRQSTTTYETQSPLFSKMLYIFDDKGGYIKSASYAVSTNDMKNNLDNFVTFLGEKGFKQESDYLYKNEDLSVLARIVISKKQAVVIYTYIPEQDKAYPSFKKFPYPPYMNWGADKAQIDSFEAKNGGSVNESITRIGGNRPDTKKPYKFDFLAFNTQPEDEGQTSMHLYLVGHKNEKQSGLYEVGMLMKNTELAFYKSGGGTALTKEFKEVCKKEGFEYVDIKTNFFRFINKEKKLGMMVGYADYGGNIGAVIHLIMYKVEPKEASYQALSLKLQ